MTDQKVISNVTFGKSHMSRDQPKSNNVTFCKSRDQTKSHNVTFRKSRDQPKSNV